jgi:WD40 repeat protein
LHPGSPVHFAAFSPNGRRVATTSDAGLRLWDAETGEPAGPLIKQPFQVYDSAYAYTSPRPSFSPDGRRLLAAASGGQVWDARTGALVSSPKQHGLDLSNAWFSPDGRRTVTAAGDSTLRVWDAATGDAVLAPLKHGISIVQAAFAPDGHRLVTFCRDGTLRVWETATAAPRAMVLQHRAPAQEVETGGVNHASFSPDGRRVITASGDRTARVWDTVTGRPVSPPLRHGERVTHAVFSPDGRRAATGSFDGKVQIWDVASGKLLTPPPQHKNAVYDVNFSPDGRRVVATGQVDCRVWDAQSGRPVSPWLAPDASDEGLGGVRASFSPDGRRVVLTTLWKRAGFIWDAVSGRLMAPPLQHQGHVFDAEFSPDGGRVATASWDGTARVWDSRSGKPITPPLRHTDKVFAANFSPDGRRVVTASDDRTARVWDAATGRPITPPLAHREGVYSAVFSPDGRSVATTAWDGEARVWDTSTGQPITPALPSAGGSGLGDVSFSPDGHRLLTPGGDGTARIWTLLPDERSPQDMARLARLLTGSRIDSTGGMVPLSPQALEHEWQSLHASSPGDFRTAADELLAWHRQEAEECVKAGLWGEVARHLTPLINAEPWNDELRFRRAKAGARAGQLANLPPQDVLAWHKREAETSEAAQEWKVALAHLTPLVQSEPQNGPLRRRRARAYAALGRWEQAFADTVKGREAEPHQVADGWYQQALQIVARVTSREVRLQWRPLPSALEYHVYRGPSGARPTQLVRLASQPGIRTDFVDHNAGLVNGQPITYAVAPVFRGGRTGGAGAVPDLEGPPVTLQVIALAAQQGWMGSSINEGERSGSVAFQPAAGEITIRGSGANIREKADGCYFLHQPLTGDFQVTVRALTRPTPSHRSAKAGLMLRESLELGSRDAFLLITAGNGFWDQTRATANGQAVERPVIDDSKLKLPILLRLTRRGNRISAEYSTDNGRSYRAAVEPQSFEPGLAKTLLVGLAITSHDATKVTEARFRSLEIRKQ